MRLQTLVDPDYGDEQLLLEVSTDQDEAEALAVLDRLGFASRVVICRRPALPIRPWLRGKA